MKIFGIDFTSAPSSKKAITYAQCTLSENNLFLEGLGRLASFEEFERFLGQPGSWTAGIDFPFGQPRTLIENLHWPQTWDGYVGLVARMAKPQFVETLFNYCRERSRGDKHHLRVTDKLSRSRSPMMLYRVPVAKMFFEGAPRLWKAGVNIRPCSVQDDPRLVLEAYPALVARRWIGNHRYKMDTPQQQTPDLGSAREEMIHGLRSPDARTHFGFDVRFDDAHADVLIQDGSGDRLDALLCAVQAAWAYSQRARNFGVPLDCDPLEGWIVDPLLSACRE
jgi:hypothetical protein